MSVTRAGGTQGMPRSETRSEREGRQPGRERRPAGTGQAGTPGGTHRTGTHGGTGQPAGADGPGAGRGARRGLRIPRVFSTAGTHPYEEVAWERRDVVQTNWRTGETIFEQAGVEFPADWSMNATTIVTTKYFRGAVGSADREHSLKQVIDRVVGAYTAAGREHGYFATDADAVVFAEELTWLLLHQHFAFNSPVWFNVGTPSPQQVSACFILSVDDTMESILNWYREEGLIFKGGSGAGLNLSRIRSSKELLSSGGTASGPVSFMRGADASAGTIKSGGATRRAAKMVVLDVDHPDIAEFVQTKAREEQKIRALRAAGFEMDLDGRDIVSVQYQNANNSVRVTGEFMRAVEDGTRFGLRARQDGRVLEEVDARALFRSIAQAAWECADPGLQYDDTINDWHTSPEAGRISASNPCSEYMHLDNSSCNLSSINLLKFLRADDTFDVDRFVAAVELITTAMDISICFADFPTEAIAETTRAYRQLGIGYANLGALLMATGHGYDSDGGRALAASITSLMTATAYRRSAELAAELGAYAGYSRDAAAHQRVMRKHAAANDDLRTLGAMDAAVHAAATAQWQAGLTLGAEHGWRNAQASLLAPTGTIGFMMDCDTTGIEPDFSLVKFKKLVGGGSMQIVNQTVPRALRRLGYAGETVEAIVEHIAEHGHVVDAPGLRPEHYEVFDTAMGRRSIAPMGHVQMMAAVQPFLSGAISKTVNLPESATVEDIEQVYFDGWKLGLKALAVYRDNCKVGQPLSDAKAAPASAGGSPGASDGAAGAAADAPAGTGTAAVAPTAPAAVVPTTAGPDVPAPAVRKRLPKQRQSITTSFTVGGAEGYLTAGSYPNDGLGEVFLKLGKQGSTLSGVMDAFSIAVSVGLQHGVPLETFVRKFTNLRFEPAGLTDDPDVRMAQSIMDYIFRRLALDHLPFETRASMGIYTTAERARALETGSYEPAPAEVDLQAPESGTAPGTPHAPTASGPAGPTAGGPAGPTPAGPAGPTAAGPAAPASPRRSAHSSAELLELQQGQTADAPLCMSCGIKMRPAGTCYVCEGCGATSGCS
ncbi:vitamin B12-dependent ribonucleotide reductase [Georgenia sp. TF02-10]|uniref:vitamin B12-dependent ribonucleotide reductase n=1 Tax=Georgenia sp. TF02-10 TaxID=2917725 RepID=UPI001FA71B24|nr:vitamin B12-dependent ribonucleotide reductase [Georgenia sp. TF02-10]UNX54872.1 vitamin B12-dependent ribonucleotide reductase [Georgenia sp. TF02-10]